ncbi:MAG: AAA family ATPase, partial [Tissierellia bacterium]|nr:AAA family ATPase [Tissierellia bacterium]
MSLILIQESVQIIAEAVKALLNVDVTIADNQLIRIAATGNYKKLIGEKMPKGCLFEKIIEDRRHDMVVRATEVDGCENCQSKEVCLEKA